MLIKKSGYTKGDVVTLRLVTGEEVVGKLEDETETDFVLSRPLTLATGRDGLGFTHPTITGDNKEDFIIQRKHVMLHNLTKEEFKQAYLESTSGIQIAKNI